ncbi:hypothetical protein ACOI22_02760 [Glaciecola sp. 2405UD65-10]|uniref:hypothetical protein n=1 Tax=Glaciecola sp. 2405UD65-10 TaxID=3397244 RepID=UPI003B5BAA32
MPKHKYAPNPALLSILKSKGTTEYCVTEIRDILLKSTSEKRDKNDIRRWVNGQFKTLVKHGYISLTSQKGIRTSYNNTNKILLDAIHDTEQISTKMEAVDHKMDGLKSRLKSYQTELLVSSGETKEYEELCVLYPEWRHLIQNKFNSSKEKNIELIGRVKAIEALLSEDIK